MIKVKITKEDGTVEEREVSSIQEVINEGLKIAKESGEKCSITTHDDVPACTNCTCRDSE